MVNESEQKVVGSATWKKVIWILLFSVLLLPVLLPTIMILFVSMLPTLVAYVVDRHRDKYLASTVGFINFCGTVPAIAQLWLTGHNLTNAQKILGDVYLWFVAYGAAGFGWLIYLMMPALVGSYYAVYSRSRLTTLAKQKEELLEFWGEDLAEGIDSLGERVGSQGLDTK
jgi:hypothetical protein|tara:strand:- start:1554 stop:2063 length:510 start_codon:yes stop_codon:yes gene_type:complete